MLTEAPVEVDMSAEPITEGVFADGVYIGEPMTFKMWSFPDDCPSERFYLHAGPYREGPMSFEDAHELRWVSVERGAVRDEETRIVQA